MATYSAKVNILVRAAEKAGKALIRDFGEVENLQVSKKGQNDFVTNADLKSEKIIVEELKKARPQWGFITEEEGNDVIQGDHCFIIDPIDGTNNFIHGIPHFAISIAIHSVALNKIVAGVVFNPIIDELYWAEDGKGAYLNNKRIRVSGRTNLMESVYGIGSIDNARKRRCEPAITSQQLLNAVNDNILSVRVMGSASLGLAYVAAGRYDGFAETCIKRWDIAAGVLLVQEAGGKVTDLVGGNNYMENGDIIASNFETHDKVLGFIKKI